MAICSWSMIPVDVKRGLFVGYDLRMMLNMSATNKENLLLFRPQKVYILYERQGKELCITCFFGYSNIALGKHRPKKECLFDYEAWVDACSFSKAMEILNHHRYYCTKRVSPFTAEERVMVECVLISSHVNGDQEVVVYQSDTVQNVAQTHVIVGFTNNRVVCMPEYPFLDRLKSLLLNVSFKLDFKGNIVIACNPGSKLPERIYYQIFHNHLIYQATPATSESFEAVICKGAKEASLEGAIYVMLNMPVISEDYIVLFVSNSADIIRLRKWMCGLLTDILHL